VNESCTPRLHFILLLGRREAQPAHVALDLFARVGLAAVARALLQLGGGLAAPPSEDVDGVPATIGAPLSAEHLRAEPVVVAQRGAANGVGGANPLRGRAGDHAVGLGGAQNLLLARFHGQFGLRASLVLLAVALKKEECF